MTSPAQAELKREYRRNLEVGFIAALVLVLVAFLFFPPGRPAPRGATLETIVFLFPEETSETPQPVEPVDVPRIPVAHFLEEVHEVEMPVEDPLRDPDAAALPPLPSSSDAPLVEFDFAPKPRNIVRPDYPEAARAAGVEGFVRLRVTVAADGTVEDAQILEADFAPFGESALKAVRYWTFLPASRAGRPVRASIVLPIEFVLTERDRS